MTKRKYTKLEDVSERQCPLHDRFRERRSPVSPLLLSAPRRLQQRLHSSNLLEVPLDRGRAGMVVMDCGGEVPLGRLMWDLCDPLSVRCALRRQE